MEVTQLSRTPELRSEGRKMLRQRAKVLADARPLMHAMTTDISEHGLGLIAPDPLQIGQQCIISFELFGRAGPINVVLKGRVTNCTLNGMDGYRTGILIVQVHPDSVHVLQKLLK